MAILRRFRFLLLCSVFTLSAAGQQNPPATSGAPSISIQVRVVSVSALVRDKQGNTITNLGKDDFVLREDGKVQPIRYFNHDNDLPLTLGLMIDTSGSMKQHIEDEQAASKEFLSSTMTQVADRAFLIRFDSRVLLFQALTSEVPKLQTALEKMSDLEEPDIYHTHGGTLLYTGIYTASKLVISKARGNRAIIIMTDGDDRGSTTPLLDAIREAQLADVAIYTILYESSDGGFGHGVGRFGSGGGDDEHGHDVMQRICEATGGRLFVVSDRLPVQRIFAQIQDDLRSQYHIGFTPVASAPKTFHTIELKSRIKHQIVQARTGYFTPAD